VSEQPIEPSSVTKPIQLLAAWLVGLLALTTAFLAAAANIHHPTWASGFLIICAALNVPIFLVCIFLLQTKFRPEMQEDQFYAKYLERRVSVETGMLEIVEFDVKKPRRSTDRPSRSLSDIDNSPQVGLNFLLGGIDVQLNDLLPRSDDIVEAISRSGITIEGIFGSTSSGKNSPPYNLVSISPNVNIKSLQILLTNMDGMVDFIGPANQHYDNGKIYIGSYAYEDSEIPKAKYTSSVKRKILRPGLTRSDLIDVIGVEPLEE
jgi:hypothetical protein